MIESISIEGIASYKGSRVVLNDLSLFNFVYGPNGSGKTTISRLIANVSAYPNCSLSWKNGRELETLVYNRDFVSRVFVEARDLPGIFSLGVDNADLLTQIEEKKERIENLKEHEIKFVFALDGDEVNGGKRGELVVAKEILRDACWDKRGNLGEVCFEAFKGYLTSKTKFVDAVLSRQLAQNTVKRTKQYLQERASTIFGDPPIPIFQLERLNWAMLREIGQPMILSKAIVGKEDIDIGALIQKLGNSDWVKSGQEMLLDSDGKCPFCQNILPSTLEKDLNDYFDETYLNDILAINRLQDGYEIAVSEVMASVNKILLDPPLQLEAEKVKDKRDALFARLITNKERIRNKRKEPSSIVNLEDVTDLTSELEELIQKANDEIAAHNAIVRNHAAEKRSLIDECWKYLIDEELTNELSIYVDKRSRLESAITSIESKLNSTRLELNNEIQNLAELQKKTTSIEPTITAINGVLQSFGFEGFKLAKAEATPCYKLIRSDGSDAKDTLSEGERTFVTFLYFHYLIQGSHENSGAMNDRVVVFDDPVSSLDSDVLFIVSTLIKRVQQDILNDRNHVKQLIILTHNVYFHKEVTYNPNGSCIGQSQMRYWIVRKVSGCSSAIYHEKNPIKTGYDLLWAELRSPSGNTVATQNTMRRILEHYFKVLGGRDPLDICREFEGADQVTCRSLISWINDGSHHASDDLYMVVDQETIDNYLRVFRLIFQKTNHLGHYDMMMGTPPGVLPQEL